MYYGVPVDPKSNSKNDSESNKKSEASKKKTAEDDAIGSLIFDVRKGRYNFTDLVLSDEVLADLEVLQSMIRNHSLVYETWGMSKIDPYGNQIAFNLYGPPGTGKTMIVEALCNMWNKQLIDINLSQLESKYVGDTGKNIVKAFKKARETGALLFFDEADTVLGRRLAEVTQSADSSVNTARGVMLKQLEQHNGIIAFATNFPKNYDNAFLRRILKHVHIPLPDKELRKTLWEKKIPKNAPGRYELDFTILSDTSEGLSGGEILNSVKNALFKAASMSPPKLTMDMLLESVKQMKEAKKNIGKSVNIDICEISQN